MTAEVSDRSWHAKGLGLIGIEERVREFGGSFEIQSGTGAGTQFCGPIRLARRTGCLSLIRVLVADDHGVVRKGSRFLLTQQPNIEVVGEAEDGREAVRLRRKRVPHVVIMDIAMPQLNGLDARPRLRNEPKHRGHYSEHVLG